MIRGACCLFSSHPPVLSTLCVSAAVFLIALSLSSSSDCLPLRGHWLDGGADHRHAGCHLDRVLWGFRGVVYGADGRDEIESPPVHLCAPQAGYRGAPSHYCAPLWCSTTHVVFSVGQKPDLGDILAALVFFFSLLWPGCHAAFVTVCFEEEQSGDTPARGRALFFSATIQSIVALFFTERTKDSSHGLQRGPFPRRGRACRVGCPLILSPSPVLCAGPLCPFRSLGVGHLLPLVRPPVGFDGVLCFRVVYVCPVVRVVVCFLSLAWGDLMPFSVAVLAGQVTGYPVVSLWVSAADDLPNLDVFAYLQAVRPR